MILWISFCSECEVKLFNRFVVWLILLFWWVTKRLSLKRRYSFTFSKLRISDGQI